MEKERSFEPRTRIVRSTRSNGDIYILERQTVYDPEKKYNRIIKTKLLSKIPKGSKTPVPTRPKRKKNVIQEKKELEGEHLADSLKAERTPVLMTDMLDWIGACSGIDAALYRCTDVGTAQKIISIARYLLATDGQSLPGISVWQLNHSLPYEDGISENVYHELFHRIGSDETLQQKFFALRCEGLKGKPVLAYDSTTVSTFSNRQPEARYGFNKAGDGLKTIKVLTLYDVEGRQPIAFAKQPGNVPDVMTIRNMICQLSALGVGDAEIITDNGYYSAGNLSALLQAGFDFITLANIGLKWIRPEIDNHKDALDAPSSVCPFDPATHGVCVARMHEFTRKRKYASKAKELAKGAEETFQRRVYLHIYFNQARKSDEDTRFYSALFSIKARLEAGVPLEHLSQCERSMAAKYLERKTRKDHLSVKIRDGACKEAVRYHGYFALVSAHERDPFAALRKYRKRETIEDFFEAGKEHADGMRPRVWDSVTLSGRMFVQFVALCYREHFAEQLRKIKSKLSEYNEKDSQDICKLKKQLLSWLRNTPLYLVLQWFDVIENISVSSKVRSLRWQSEIVRRDRFFIGLLAWAWDLKQYTG